MTDPERPPLFPSAALHAANARLMALRATFRQVEAQADAVPPALSSSGTISLNDRLLPLLENRAEAPATDPAPDAPDTTATPVSVAVLDSLLKRLPSHLGWHSAAVTTVLRREQAGRLPAASEEPPRQTSQETAVWPPVASAAIACAMPSETAVWPPVVSAAIASPMPSETAVWPLPDTEALKLHPSLALALLRAGETAPGRLWLLLRWLDENGRGCLPLTVVRARLTKGDSPTRLCGQRQLRSLLQQGNGLFWQRDKTHVWLASTVNVAAGLGVVRLTGRPIALPLAVLLEPIGLVRAHLYASFHSSRLGETGKESAPISRVALTAVSGVCRRTQHAYEDRAGVRVQANIALGAPLSQNTAAAEEAAWQHGRTAFILTDSRGTHGKPGQRYLAWRLPNSFSGPHIPLGRGRQRHLNRQLADLRRYGDAGNGHFGGACAELVEVLSASRLREDAFCRRRYTANGALAGRCLRRQPDALVYWRGRGECGAVIWYVLANEKRMDS